MQYTRAKITRVLIDFFEDDDRRIDHAMRVLFHADHILAKRDDCDVDLVVAVALLHDVGIKPAEAELGFSNGETQEQYGPPIAETLLEGIGFSPEKIVKAKEIIGNHHSRSRYDYPELEVLKAADHIVNTQDAG